MLHYNKPGIKSPSDHSCGEFLVPKSNNAERVTQISSTIHLCQTLRLYNSYSQNTSSFKFVGIQQPTQLFIFWPAVQNQRKSISELKASDHGCCQSGRYPEVYVVHNVQLVQFSICTFIVLLACTLTCSALARDASTLVHHTDPREASLVYCP